MLLNIKQKAILNPTYIYLVRTIFRLSLRKESFAVTAFAAGVVLLLGPKALSFHVTQSGPLITVIFHCILQFLHAWLLLPWYLIFASQRRLPLLPLIVVNSILSVQVGDALWRIFIGYPGGYFSQIGSQASLAILASIAVATIVFLVISKINEALALLGLSPVSMLPRPEAPDDSKLRTYLPSDRRAQIIRLEAQGDHVVLHTETLKYAVRLTLKEAVDLVDPDAGITIHRSHWVRKTAMSAFKYENGNPRLVMTNGTILPISRSVSPLVKAVLKLNSELQTQRTERSSGA